MSENLAHTNTVGFPIVGMVASAGGLDAFKRFFSAMSSNSGMAFVLIPHLDPTHESLMVGLLGNLTPMPVVEAQQGMAVEINTVYIIPPNKFMTIDDGQLQLSVPPFQLGWQTSIDFFLRSLAQDQTERSIGIVLSGTGSHGALGVREIKLVGGMTMAQQPDTAEYDQMPINAIATGQIDCILAPEQMPAALVKYIEQPYLSSAGKSLAPSAESTDLLNQVLSFVQARTKYDFRSYRKAMVLRRIQRRMGLAQIDSMTNYVKLLHERPEEATALYQDLLISVTAFFRDPEAFHVLEHEVVPALLSRHADGSPIRVWVPGCATGEEAYSIAMLFFEGISALPTRETEVPSESTEDQGSALESSRAEPNAGPPVLQVFASDIDIAAIEFARAGIYPASVVGDVSPGRLSRFFVPVDDNHYRINKQLRESIVFSHQNVIADSPFSKLDLVSCRNLLIYLEPGLQQKVIALFHFALATNGYLLLGPSESIGRTSVLFATVSKKWRLYHRVGPGARDTIGVPLNKSDEQRKSLPHHTSAGTRSKSLKDLAERLVLNDYAPATVLISRKHEILYMTGRVVEYLEFPMGELTKDLLVLARPGLRTKLQIACSNAIREGRTVVDYEARVKRNGRYVPCSITVRPLTEPKEAEGLTLVTFQDRDLGPVNVSAANTVGESNQHGSLQGDDSELVQQLEFELKSLNEELHSTIEEMESSTEELKTSNEEIMSVNEELQSANEELETSKEELQSLNEELSTINSQLQEKVVELDQAKDDLINLMASSDIAMIFLDKELNIKRYTPQATSFLNLRPADLGRPLSDITPKFPNDQMLIECREVLETLVPIEREIRTDKSRYYLRRILPYQTTDHHLGGAVVAFVDLTQQKLLELEQREKDAAAVAALHESTERLAAILDTAADAIVTFDQNGKIDSINRATESLFGYSRKELLGQLISQLIPSINSGQLNSSIEDYFEHQQVQGLGSVRETVALRKNGSTFPVDLALGKVDHLGLFTGIVRDITARKKLQAHLLEIVSEEQRRIGHELHDGTQQELTGLTLFAGGLCELLETAVPSDLGEDEEDDPQDKQNWTLAGHRFQKLKQTASRLLKGLKTANQHVHELSHGIMPVQIDGEGLRSALAELAEMTNGLNQVSCRFESSGISSISNNLIATQLYRITQESLNNALQHGRADEIQIRLSQQDDAVTLEICDNGLGFDSPQSTESETLGRGMGLRIMEYRASLLGGSLQIERNKGPGVTIRCVIPTRKDET
jgi:two-component system, chemotaxis family, CheB/CheR fusion protein